MTSGCEQEDEEPLLQSRHLITNIELMVEKRNKTRETEAHQLAVEQSKPDLSPSSYHEFTTPVLKNEQIEIGQQATQKSQLALPCITWMTHGQEDDEMSRKSIGASIRQLAAQEATSEHVRFKINEFSAPYEEEGLAVNDSGIRHKKRHLQHRKTSDWTAMKGKYSEKHDQTIQVDQIPCGPSMAGREKSWNLMSNDYSVPSVAEQLPFITQQQQQSHKTFFTGQEQQVEVDLAEDGQRVKTKKRFHLHQIKMQQPKKQQKQSEASISKAQSKTKLKRVMPVKSRKNAPISTSQTALIYAQASEQSPFISKQQFNDAASIEKGSAAILANQSDAGQQEMKIKESEMNSQKKPSVIQTLFAHQVDRSKSVDTFAPLLSQVNANEGGVAVPRRFKKKRARIERHGSVQIITHESKEASLRYANQLSISDNNFSKKRLEVSNQKQTKSKVGLRKALQSVYGVKDSEYQLRVKQQIKLQPLQQSSCSQDEKQGKAREQALKEPFYNYTQSDEDIDIDYYCVSLNSESESINDDCNQKEGSMNQIKDGSFENANSSQSRRMNQGNQQNSKRPYELHNLTLSSSIIDQLIKKGASSSPNRAEQVEQAKQASAFLTNKLPKQNMQQQSPRTAEQKVDRLKVIDHSSPRGGGNKASGKKQQMAQDAMSFRISEVLNEEDSVGALKKPNEMHNMQQKHSRAAQSYTNNHQERNHKVGSSSSTNTYNWNVERGQSQVIASSGDCISRQQKDPQGHFNKHGLKSSSKIHLNPPAINSSEVIQVEMSAFPAITQLQRNAPAGSSMMNNKSKKESKTTWGKDWTARGLIDNNQELSKKSKHKQKVAEHVKNLPLSSFSFQTTDFKTSSEQPDKMMTKITKQPRSTLPSALPDKPLVEQFAPPYTGQRMKSINMKATTTGDSSLTTAAVAVDQRQAAFLLAKKGVLEDQKMLNASFLLQEQHQQYNHNIKKTKLKRRERLAQPSIEQQYTSIEVSEDVHGNRKMQKVTIEDKSVEQQDINNKDEKEVSNMKTPTPKQLQSQKVGLIVKTYAVGHSSDKRRILNQKLDSLAKHNQVQLKNTTSMSPHDSSVEQLKSAKAIKFGSPKNVNNSATVQRAQRTQVGFAKNVNQNNGKTKMRAGIYINGSLGALNKSPKTMMQVVENSRVGGSAHNGFYGTQLGGSGKTSMRKQQQMMKDSAYLSAQRVTKENNKLHQQAIMANTATITSDNSTYSPYEKKQGFPILQQPGNKMNQMEDLSAQVYTNYHTNVQQQNPPSSLKKQTEHSKTTYRRKVPGAVGRESSTSYGNFERFAADASTGFSLHQNAHDRVALHEQLTDMIFKNVQQLAQQDINTREIAREKHIIRESLKGKTIEEISKIEEQARSASKLIERQPPSHKVSRKDEQQRNSSVAADTSVDPPQTRTEQLKIALAEKQKSTIVLSFRSQDKWLRRAAQVKGWIENAGHGSHLFNVKWEYSDSSQDVYKQLQRNQFYNHFPDSRELTTKQGLNQNLHQITTPGVDIYGFYPRCYDLSDQRQVDLFKDDFNRTAILCCLKKHARYFKNQCREIMKEIQVKDNLILNNQWKEENKRQLKRSYIGKFPPEGSIEKVNTILLRNAIFYARSLLLLDQDCEGEEFIKKNYYQPNFLFNQRILNIVVKYAELDVPMLPEQLQKKTNALTSLEDERELILAYYNDVLKFRGWEIPNVYVMYQAYKVHKELKMKYPQYGQIDGSDNVWICKPSFTARGVGIFCFRSLRELFNGQAKKHMCPKIVQKYVERSFLLEKQSVPSLNDHVAVELRNNGRKSSVSPSKMLSASPNRRANYTLKRKSVEEVGSKDMRKFDLRQWVYVNSFDPLSVFIYKKTYLRICGAHFDLSQFEDAQRHISNYSVQKDSELVLSSDDFIEYLKKKDPIKYGTMTWENFFLPQVDHIVKQTLTQMAEVIESRQNSFELYGFDFVVDKDLRLWLIEVNMSPACAERQPWLIEMLDDMATGLVNMIMAKVNAHRDSLESNNQMTFNTTSAAQDTNQRTKLYTKLQKQNLLTAIEGTNWTSMSKCDGFVLTSSDRQVKVKIPQSQQQINMNPNNFDKQSIEVVGKKANLKMERYLDYMCQRIAAAVFIQKLYRGYLVRKSLHQQRQLKLKIKTMKNKAVRIITENLQLAFDRVQVEDKRKLPFSRLKTLYLDKMCEELILDSAKLHKIVQLQRLARGWLHRNRVLGIGQLNPGEILDAEEMTLSLQNLQVTSAQQQEPEPILLMGTKRRRTTPHQQMRSQDGGVVGGTHDSGLEQPSRNEVTAGIHSSNVTIQKYVVEEAKSQESMNFIEDDPIVQRGGSSQRARSGEFKNPHSINSQSGSVEVNSQRQQEKIVSRSQSTTLNNVESKIKIKCENQHQSKNSKTRELVQRQQLDSYLLLDYRAVGVDLIIPQLELEKGKKLRAYASKAHTALGESKASNVGYSSKYRYRSNQVNNNFAFSPRFDCQQSAQVGMFVSSNKNERTQAQTSTLREELVKRASQSKKIKNQIFSAYVDNKVRIRPTKPVRD